ncbi:hypothetical protein [Pontibacillus sp. HN14]|nr:hypothetical protein [Pontibacillus sp. HN14]
MNMHKVAFALDKLKEEKNGLIELTEEAKAFYRNTAYYELKNIAEEWNLEWYSQDVSKEQSNPVKSTKEERPKGYFSYLLQALKKRKGKERAKGRPRRRARS